MRAALKPVLFPQWTPRQLGGALKLWIDPYDLGTMQQSNAGTIAVLADGESVGYLADKSPNRFDLSSAADDTTRPVYKVSGNRRYLSFTAASSQYLRRTSSLGLIGGTSGYSIFCSINSGTASGTYLFGEGSSSSNNPIWAPVRSGTSPNAVCYFRDDTGGEYLNLTPTTANVFDSTDNIFGLVDTGGAVSTYLDGDFVASATYTYSASTFNRFALGSLLRASAASHATFDLYQLIIVGRAVTESERRKITSFMARKIGRVL